MILLKSHSRFLLQTLLNRLHINSCYTQFTSRAVSEDPFSRRDKLEFTSNVCRKWIWVRYMAITPSHELKTENGAVRFNSSNNLLVTKDSPVKRNDENKIKRAKKSEKAKVNELKLFQLMERKKMNSPNPEVRIRYQLEEAKLKEAWLIEKLRKFEVPKALPKAHDPEILTEEEKHYLDRTEEKKKSYIPVRPEVMSPTDTLSKDGALAKYKDSQSLEHTRKVIEKLEKELEEYQKHIAEYEATKESQDSKHFMHFEDLVLYFNFLKKY